MDKKLPKVFANKIDGKTGNNEDVYYSHDERKVNTAQKPTLKKEKKIFNSTSYIYKADVKITLKNGSINKRIVGRNSTHLITIDNELIPITDILDIEKS